MCIHAARMGLLGVVLVGSCMNERHVEAQTRAVQLARPSRERCGVASRRGD